jgi:tetratricopeptide (TPR) repeat protein
VRRGVAIAIGLGVLAALAWFAAIRLTQPVLAFRERDFIVIADVVNGTGETVFDLALKSALETGLRQSRYVNVLDSIQVQNALRRMRLEPATRLDPEVGRDVCRRVGAPALLVPRILRAGNAYQIQVALIEPPTGRTLDEVHVTARSREEVLLSSIDQLTRQLRGRLGESLASVARTDPPFAQYTTSSLEALQLLAVGQRAWWVEGDFAKAERSFRESLKHDPRFAMARGSLGLVLIQFLGRADEGKKMLVQALEEEGQVSEREYLHLRALNKQFVTKDLQGALDDYRFISGLYPDLMAPYNNSGRILQQLGRFQEAAAMYERSSKADPRHPVPLQNLWFLAISRLKDPALGERTARALLALRPDQAAIYHQLAWSLLAQRRFGEAEEAVRAALKLDPANAYALPNLGHLQFRRGAMSDAAATYRQVLAFAAEGRLKTGLEHVWLSLGLAEASAGQAAEAGRTLLGGVEKIRSRGAKAGLPPADRAMAAAMLAAAGRRDEARLLAESAGGHAKGTVDVNYELARAWTVIGDRARAVRFLEAAFAALYDDAYMIVVDPPLAGLQGDPVVETLAPGRPAPGGTGAGVKAGSGRPPQ